MPRFHTFCMAACTALAAAGASAQGAGEYTLNQGFVHFSAPPQWPVMMQKTEGNPQFVALQVKDPADTGTEEASRVTVETKLLDDSGNFQALINVAMDKARQAPGFEQRTDGVEASTLRYFALNGKTRYEYRETWYLNGHVSVHVRCARPMLAQTTAQWTAEYDKGCAQIMQSLHPH